MKSVAVILTVVIAVASFGLISCSPRDPDVLSQADRDFIKAQKNKGKVGADGFGGKIRPLLPQRVDLSLGLLMMDRESEALLILKNAESLLKSDADKIQDGCVRTKLIEKEKNSRIYQISKELCLSTFADVGFSVNGVATLKMDMNDQGELTGLQYDTPNLVNESLDITEYQVGKKDVKMSFIVKDEVHLKIDKKENAKQYRVSSLQANTTYRQLVGAAETVGQISYEADGDWILLETGGIQSQFHAKLRFKSQVSNAGDGTAGGDSYFDLVIDSYSQIPAGAIKLEQCSRAQATYHYDLSFGRDSRQGSLSLDGNQLVAQSKDPKTQKEDRASLNLNDCSGRAPLAWDQLMIQKN